MAAVKMHECSALVIPRCGPASPFKGHLSNKSNAFCIGSSRNLASQYLIRDHMVVHYNRILSAKAAVDCSLPKSRLASIKLADQQRREKLKKKIARCGEKLSVCEAVSPSRPRDRGRLLPSSFRKSLLEAEDGVSPSAGQAQYLSGAPSAYGEDCLVHSSPVKCTRKCSQNPAGASHSSVCVSRPPGKRSAFPRSRSIESFVSVGCSQRCQGHHPRASGGDLLERHSEYFTKSRKPFTPRTLVSDAKPFLSEYRFYTPARRKKKNHRKQRVEAQTQTDIISFPPADKVPVRKVTSEKQKIKSKAEDKRYTLDEPERGIDDFQQSILRETSWCPQKSSPKRAVDAEEEELLYLTFIEEVTNEILRLGLFSNRILDQLFECHIEENKNRLDEAKMRQMLDVLKSDLGCSQDSDTELTHAGQEASGPLDQQECDTTEELTFASKGHRLRKATKNEEFLETVDFSLKKPNKCGSPSRSKRSRETQGKENFSEDTMEMMGAGRESDFCGAEFEEHPDTSPTCEAALNLFTCDSDFEVNKELDELDENFADALHISHNHS
ncbi:spermatogenesis-associated protein 7 isoform X2 [Motacilla alba alba]|uniref:spermatogenesis-associated protein 7 isoform X2 n=1 Tax=Motacilla alba alba TaxID=1094192 RepID=UPI0018D50CBA|nr:spermatogenesis-associated protein 7 isoform X2 [Motacilla alba alba]